MVMINPAVGSSYNWDMSQIVRVLNKKTVNSPLALPLLAAYMPENWDVEIVDEEIQKIDFNDKPDLVALSLLTIKTVRGYQIASEFRKRGVKVLLGGPHVTLNADEAGQYADAVVIGEGEKVWLELLRDYEKGNLKEKYQSVEYCEFKTSPIPRWDLLDQSKIMTFNVQVSRGCPYSCEFCSVRTLFGRKQRYRDVDDVIRELSTFKPGTVITFADDNLTANRKFIKELLRKMIPLKLMWNCQASIDCAFDPQLLQLMHDSGCLSILIGFETLDRESLEKMNKPQNSLDDYEKAISNIHSYGIHIYASFIIGLDNDTVETFKRIEDFTLKNNLCYVMVNALNAFKGTDFYKRLEQEGRILDVGYDATGNARSNVRAKKITPLDSFNGILDLQENITSPESVYKKSVALLLNGSFTHDNGEDVSFSVKFKSTFFFLFKYILSFNKWNRRLFFNLLRGVKEKKLSFFCFVQHILFMETFRQSFKKMHRIKKPVLKELENLHEN
jgi:radical SAM superfamily enzyme YgiQ (UPF0313 family)